MDRRPAKRVSPRELALSVAGVTGMWAAGVTQPTLDLYGKNATLFTAAKLSTSNTVAFALLIAFSGPVIWLIGAVGLCRLPRAFRVWRGGAIGIGGMAAILVAANRYDVPSTASLVGAPALALVLALVYERASPARTIAALMALLAPISVGLFLGASPVGHVTWASQGADAAIPVADLARRPTIVWLVFDETNLAMLLDGAGRIDAVRYPNLAALAGTSTWYRNAVGIDSQTHGPCPVCSLAVTAPASSGRRRRTTR